MDNICAYCGRKATRVTAARLCLSGIWLCANPGRDCQEKVFRSERKTWKATKVRFRNSILAWYNDTTFRILLWWYLSREV